MKVRRLLCLSVAAAIASPAFAADPRAAGTPAPRKKSKAELEAEEDPHPAPQPANSADWFVVAMPLVGTWEEGGRRLIIENGGKYTLAGAEVDAGSVTAELGRLMRRSKRTGTWISGTYTLRDINVLETDGAFGKREWRRVR